MKLSKYNLYREINDKVLIYNFLSGEFGDYYGAAGSSAIIRFCCFSYISILPLVTAYHNDHTSTFLSFLICC